MSLVQTGDTSHLTSPLQANVVSTADNGAGEIRVQTAAPHLFGSGDVVEVFTDTNEGTYQVTIIDSTHFDLDGTTFVSSGSGEAIDMSLTPQILCPTDGDTFSAQLSGLLSAFQGVMDRTQRLQSNIVANYNLLAAVQWRPAYQPVAVPATWGSINAVAFDIVTRKWIIAGEITSTSRVQLALGRGADSTDWITGSADSVATNVISVCRGIESSSPANKWIYVAGQTSGAGELFAYDTNVNAWTNRALPDNTNVTDAKVVSLSGQLLVFTGSSSTATCHIKRTTDQGATFTNIFSFSLPVPSWLIAQTDIGVGRVLAVSTNVGGLNSVSGGLDVYTTTDGITWTHTNIPGIAGNAGETPTTLCWAADYSGLGCWLLSTWDGATTRMYRAYNPGSTWTLLATNLQSLGAQLAGMAAITSVVTAIVYEAPRARLLYSLDGGIDWNLCNSTLVATAAANLAIAQGINGILAISDELAIPTPTYGTLGSFGTP